MEVPPQPVVEVVEGGGAPPSDGAIASATELQPPGGAPGPSVEVHMPPQVSLGNAEVMPEGMGDDDDDDEEEDGPPRKKRGGHGRRKIEIEYIEDKIRRHITFSKRKAGISKKAYELSRLTGAQVLLLISSERGQIYSFATPKLQPILVNENSKQLIEQCLNAPDPMSLPPPPMMPPEHMQPPPQMAPPPQHPGMPPHPGHMPHPGMPHHGMPHPGPGVMPGQPMPDVSMPHPGMHPSHMAAAGSMVGAGAEDQMPPGMMPQ